MSNIIYIIGSIFQPEHIFVILAAIAIYFIPTIIALNKRKTNGFAIFALNLFLGWTLIGWVVSLVWALTKDNKPQTIVINNQASADETINPIITNLIQENLQPVINTPAKPTQVDEEYNRLFNNKTWFQKNRGWLLGSSIGLLAVIGILFYSNYSKALNTNKSNFSFPITDSSYNRLTNDNIDEIVKGYTKEEASNIYAYKRIKKEGEPPYLIVVFKTTNNFIHFNSVKRKENTWVTQWEDSLNEEEGNYFTVSDWKFEEKDADPDEGLDKTISLQGCYPHDCYYKNGIFYYDTKNEKGYVSICSDEENFKDFFPFGVPQEYNVLKDFETQILYKLLADSYSSISEKIKHISGNILALPSSRIVPSVEPNSNISQIVDQILINQNGALGLTNKDYSCNTVFLLDYNEDKYLDYLFYVTDSKKENILKNGLYLYSGKSGNLMYLDLTYKNKYFSNDFSEYYFPPSEILLQKQLNGDSYIVVPLQPESGSFDFPKECYLFKLDNTEFKISHDTLQCAKIISNLGLDSSYVPN